MGSFPVGDGVNQGEVINIKNFLKNLKLHESTVSTVLGFLVIVVVGLLVVNYFRSVETGETFPTANQTEDSSDERTYTVAAGDTLWSISEDVYGTGFNWVEIRDANNIDNPNDLTEGQKLTIPSLDKDEEIAGATSSPEPIQSPTPIVTRTPTPTQIADADKDSNAEGVNDTEKTIVAGGTYTVVRGDNLWDIAVAAYGNGFRWIEIAEANELVHPSIIHAGNVLKIPA